MPELGFFTLKGAGATLDLTYHEAAAAEEAIGKSLDDQLHDKKVLSLHTTFAEQQMLWTETSREQCGRIVAFLQEHRAAALGNDDHEAVWSAIGFES